MADELVYSPSAALGFIALSFGILPVPEAPILRVCLHFSTIRASSPRITLIRIPVMATSARNPNSLVKIFFQAANIPSGSSTSMFWDRFDVFLDQRVELVDAIADVFLASLGQQAQLLDMWPQVHHGGVLLS